MLHSQQAALRPISHSERGSNDIVYISQSLEPMWMSVKGMPR